MYVRNLEIRNLKLLKNVSLDFMRGAEPRMWTVLLGENGLCKTSVLHAIALAASGVDRANQLAETILPSLPDARQRSARVDIEAEFAFGSLNHSRRDYAGSAPGASPRLKSRLWIEPGWKVFKGDSEFVAAEAVTSDTDPLRTARARSLPHWFVAGYGVQRALSTGGSSELPSDPVRSRLEPLFERSRAISTGFVDLFKQTSKKSASNFVHSVKAALLEVTGVLPRVADLELRGRGGALTAQALTQAQRFELRVGKKRLKVSATWLSQGYQATIAWIADLVGHLLLEADGRALEPDQMEGLVLIDELDLHLHPQWQAEFVRGLKQTFPRLQFVVTTHSPMLLPGFEADEVILMRQDDAGDVDRHTTDQSPALMTGSEIYAKFFGITELHPTDMGRKLSRYGLLFGKPKRSPAEEREKARLLTELRAAGQDPGWET